MLAIQKCRLLNPHLSNFNGYCRFCQTCKVKLSVEAQSPTMCRLSEGKMGASALRRYVEATAGFCHRLQHELQEAPPRCVRRTVFRWRLGVGRWLFAFACKCKLTIVPFAFNPLFDLVLLPRTGHVGGAMHAHEVHSPSPQCHVMRLRCADAGSSFLCHLHACLCIALS